MGGIACITALIGSASFHYGMCFYVIEMVNDLKVQVANFDDILPTPSTYLWKKAEFVLLKALNAQRISNISKNMIKEILFHKEIIKYAPTRSYKYVIGSAIIHSTHFLLSPNGLPL